MNSETIIQGIGLIAQSISDVCLAKNYPLAITDFLKGLGAFGVHTSITQALQAPVGQSAPQFKHLGDEIGKPEPPVDQNEQKK